MLELILIGFAGAASLTVLAYTLSLWRNEFLLGRSEFERTVEEFSASVRSVVFQLDDLHDKSWRESELLSENKSTPELGRTVLKRNIFHDQNDFGRSNRFLRELSARLVYRSPELGIKDMIQCMHRPIARSSSSRAIFAVYHAEQSFWFLRPDASFHWAEREYSAQGGKLTWVVIQGEGDRRSRDSETRREIQASPRYGEEVRLVSTASENDYWNPWIFLFLDIGRNLFWEVRGQEESDSEVQVGFNIEEVNTIRKKIEELLSSARASPW